MTRGGFDLLRPKTLALVGNYPPRKCGIATFTCDLLKALVRESPDTACSAVVMNDVKQGYDYPSEVQFELNYKNLAEYPLAAEFLNMNQVEGVFVQHEYGIYGGDHGMHLLELLRNLRMPVVTTLHTVLMEPSEKQKKVLEEISRYSDGFVVLSHLASDILQRVYGLPGEKISMIPHGIPDLPFVDPNYFKDQFGVEGRKVILTFGLLSQNKGIEYMIDALPAIARKYPEAIYVVVGVTHPHVMREEGEAYRHGLQLRARNLGVADNLAFHNRYVDLKELCDFLGAADIYVTPYLHKEQIASGTLAYALGAGKAVVSTPYWYAEEMLADDRGTMVPFRDADALAKAVIQLLDDEVMRHGMRKRAYNFCRPMIWKEVARRYLSILAEAREERARTPRVVTDTKTVRVVPLDLPTLRFDHLLRMTDDVGILQHANYIVPDRFNGYCTDDNARALIAVLMAYRLVYDDQELIRLAARFQSFLHHAFDESKRRFRNFMGYDRRWLEEYGSEDSHGRAVWSLGIVVGQADWQGLGASALRVFELALPPIMDFSSPRSWAFGLLGANAFLRRFGGDSDSRRIRNKLAEKLFELYRANATDDWPWIEDTVTYANGKIPQALIATGDRLQREDMVSAGLRSLEWLVRVQTAPEGHFVPIGNNGWFSRGATPARFDQQPLEAQNVIEACLEAYRFTMDKKWLSRARRCFEWFLGRNDLNAPVYDYETCGCCDGLSSDGANQNQGAESLLAWLISLLHMISLRDTEATDEVLTGADRKDRSEVDAGQ